MKSKINPKVIPKEHYCKKCIHIKVVNKSLARMTLDFSLHSNFTSMGKLKKMLNDKQVSIAGLFKGTETNLIFIENKKAMKAFIFCPKKS